METARSERSPKAVDLAPPINTCIKQALTSSFSSCKSETGFGWGDPQAGDSLSIQDPYTRFRAICCTDNPTDLAEICFAFFKTIHGDAHSTTEIPVYELDF